MINVQLKKLFIIISTSLCILTILIYFPFDKNGDLEHKKNENLVNVKREKETDEKKSYEELTLETPEKTYYSINTKPNLKKETKENVKSLEEIQHLDEAFKETENYTIYDSKKIESFSALETRDMLISLTENMFKNETQRTLDSLSEAVTGSIDSSSAYLDTVACSDKACGVLLSSGDVKEISYILNNLSFNEKLKGKLKGGTLRVFEEDGVYFGLLFSSISNKPLKIE